LERAHASFAFRSRVLEEANAALLKNTFLPLSQREFLLVSSVKTWLYAPVMNPGKSNGLNIITPQGRHAGNGSLHQGLQ
jgi:hypothetical protein